MADAPGAVTRHLYRRLCLWWVPNRQPL